MNKNVKIVFAVAGFIVFLLSVWLIYNNLSQKYRAERPLPQTTESAGPDSARKIAAPDFTAVNADGDEVRLSDYKGTPVVLNFWASWCGPCRSEMPEFNKVSQEYAEDQLVFLMVDLVDGQRETLEAGQKYVEDNNYTFRVLYDIEQDAGNKYGIRSIPTTFFIDGDGYVVTGAEGAIDEDTLRRGIEYIRPAK